MAFGKRPSNDRGDGHHKNSSQYMSGEETNLKGCPIPLPSGCVTDCSPPKSLKDGIKMVCSNTKCQFKNTLMHRECFEHLENYLVKIMSAMGSARAWTDAQRRSNLWDKKGLSLIQKLCRCKCGMGLLRLDRSCPSSADDREATPKTRKSKTKKLPKLNFNGPSTAALSDEKSNSENFITKRKQHLPYASSTSSSTSSSHYRSNSLNLQSSTKLTFSRASERLSGQNSNTSNTPHQSVWITNLSTRPEPTVFGARRPSGQITYAEATIGSASHNSDCSSEGDGSSSLGDGSSTSRRASNASDFTFSDITESLTDSYRRLSFDDDQTVFHSMPVDSTELLNSNQRQRPSFGVNAINLDISSVLLSPPITPPICSENGDDVCESSLKTELSNQSEEDADSYVQTEELRCYDLFSGQSFCLGEKLVGELYFPGAIC